MGQVQHFRRSSTPASGPWWQRLGRAWRAWRAKRVKRARRAALRGSAVEQNKELTVLQLEGLQYVFGLDWRLLPPTRRLARALAMAREEGMSWYAVSELEDVLGFVDTARWLRGPHYSASLHLAGRHSQGGVELFVLHCPNGQYAVLALQESRPLPGFDFLGDVASARALTEEFLAIQRGQPIRLVGNVDFHDGFEQISPDDLLAEPLPSSRLRSLRSWRALRRGLLVGVLVVAGAWGGHYLLEYRRQETLIQLQGSPAYQQQLYREGLRNAWATLPPAADEVLLAWADLLARLPLHVQGWQLSHIECELGQCRAHWLRRQGSHADFLAHMPTEEGEIDEVAADQDPMAGSIVTLHTLDIPADGEALTRQTLPNLRLARRTLADLLQDLQLLGMSEARVDPPQLFGGKQDKELLNDAVFSGPWSLRQALWVLPSLSLPDFVRVQTLKVDVLGKSRSTSASADTNALVARSGGGKAAATQPWFEITGTYYAKK